MGLKVILTGATGYVGEGVLLECLAHNAIDAVLVVGRTSCGRQHPKLKELLVPDFFHLDAIADELPGYDACFFCAGVSAVGMKEEAYARITHDGTLAFALAVLRASPGIQFNYVSGAGTDGSEKGRMMWARVKGRVENALGRMGFSRQNSFRPGIMMPSPGQGNIKPFQRYAMPVFSLLMPWATCTMQEVGRAMINSVLKGSPKRVLEVRDIKSLAKG